ncbi:MULTISPECIES: hypothetical protein [unclassified Crossiella]|uniref:hypothetical protein n=1 Tax=unclassified Crossiella TaxID=2620835 RepID=UPI001FFF871F|nr:MULTISPECIES: hypothetical protein [unclassified Crossiella]MCK2238586.1 hypothetical protein [Crossiella sp. S99.2]MCK2251844.1 hypothetical protein [Crossiella sp. S99.1]
MTAHEYSPEEQRGDTTAENLDEDRIGVDPLEEGVEPPEGWAEADRFGTTAREMADGEPLADRLAGEIPDQAPEVAGRPWADTPDEDLDETIDTAPPGEDPDLGESEPGAGRQGESGAPEQLALRIEQ